MPGEPAVVVVCEPSFVCPGRPWVALALRDYLECRRRDGWEVDAEAVRIAHAAAVAARLVADTSSEPVGTAVRSVGSVGRTLSSKQVASVLGISARAVTKRGRALGGWQLGRVWHFDAADYEKGSNAA